MKQQQSQRASDPSGTTLFNRRQILTTASIASGVSLMLPGRFAFAQQSPPIEPMDPDQETPIAPDNDQTPVATDDEPRIEQKQTPVDGENDVDYSSTLYFALTGHNLETPFLTAWQEAGGEDILGLPLSEARFVAGSGIQQAFQAVTLWYEPEEAGETPVSAMPIDPNVVNTLAPASARKAIDQSGRKRGATYVAETGHSISGKIADFWDAIDGERFLGRPLSEEFKENGVTRQLFECGVVELGADGAAKLWHVVDEKLLDDTTRSDAAFAPAPPTLGVTSLVSSEDGLRLRSGPSSASTILAVVANNAEFIAAPGDHGDWVPGYADGRSGWVSSQYLKQADALPVVSTANWDLSVWQGASLGETNLRDQPTTKSRSVKTLSYGAPVVVVKWVEGEAVIDDDDAWAELNDGTYSYVRNLGRSAPVEAPKLPADAPSSGRWIDVHLTQQLMVAYEGRTVKRVTVMTSGRPGWDTPAGMFAINTRVPNETMESGSIGAESFYKLEDVLYTQYFTDVGHALHFAWWKTKETIGRPGSHGCLNLLLDDAKYYWDWATIGTPVYCHF
jgi:uncharacterized protein YgiM (DUF1202 family)